MATKVLSYSTNSDFSTGKMAQKTFLQSGKINIVFYIHNSIIGASIEGIDIQTCFEYNPETEKQKKINRFFVERYIDPCFNSDELKKTFNISNQ